MPTSVTIGINSPAVVKERIPLLLEGTSVKALKIKLGSPEGSEADKAMFEQVVQSTTKYNVKLRVDANGGWDVSQAKQMMQWLADRGVDYIEQPLKEGEEENLEILFNKRPLPIYVDESCRFSENIPDFAAHVDEMWRNYRSNTYHGDCPSPWIKNNDWMYERIFCSNCSCSCNFRRN